MCMQPNGVDLVDVVGSVMVGAAAAAGVSGETLGGRGPRAVAAAPTAAAGSATLTLAVAPVDAVPT